MIKNTLPVLFLLLSSCCMSQPLNTNAKPFVVIELFTSEGCSSCPAADKALNEVIADSRKKNLPVYAMAFHVDYWNRLGWKDPYSSFVFTNRQKNYANAIGETQIYTPQIIVNGKTAFVGSDKKRLMQEIEKELKSKQDFFIMLKRNPASTTDTLIVDYEVSKSEKNLNLYVALIQRGLASKVLKGENAGKSLTHDNVVREFQNVSLASSSGRLKIPVTGYSINQNFSLYGFVQQKQNKNILGATGFDL